MRWLDVLKKVQPKAWKAISEDRCPPDLDEKVDVCPVDAPTVQEQCKLCWAREIPEGGEKQAEAELVKYAPVGGRRDNA